MNNDNQNNSELNHAELYERMEERKSDILGETLEKILSEKKLKTNKKSVSHKMGQDNTKD